MDVFSLFTPTSYTFLELEGDASGQKVKGMTETTGIIKFRGGMVQDGRSESYESRSTLKIRPGEPFIQAVGGHLGLVGHGIRCQDVDYRIEGVTAATDDDTGLVEFYRATLKKGAIVWVSDLPLE